MAANKPIAKQAINGFAWSSFNKGFAILFKLVFGVYLTRLLNPEDYGLMAMTAVFFAIAQLFVDGGFSSALIQKNNATEADLSTIFIFNFLAALFLYLLLFILSPFLSDFFDDHRLKNIFRVAGIGILISSFGTIQSTILRKNINFKYIAIVSTAAMIISFAVGILLAYYGFGVWALVAHLLAEKIVRVPFLWFLTNWRPKIIFNMTSFKTLFSFGYKIFLQNALNSVFKNIYFVIIGKYFSIIETGFYYRASSFHEIFVQNITNVITQVTFPLYSTLNNDLDRLKEKYLLGLQLAIYILFFTFTILILVSEPFVLFFLGEKWSQTIPFMVLFFFNGYFLPFYMMSNNVLNATGYSGIALKIDVIKRVITIISIIAGFSFGVYGLIIGYLASSFTSLIVSHYYSNKVLGFETKQVLLKYIPSILVSLTIMGITKLFLISYLDGVYLTQLFIIPLVGFLIFILIGFILKFRAQKELIMLMKAYLKR